MIRAPWWAWMAGTMTSPSRRALLRSFLALPVAARFAPLVSPAPALVFHQWRVGRATTEAIMRLVADEMRARSWPRCRESPPSFTVEMG